MDDLKIAMIGDLVSSRSIRERAAFDLRLKQALQMLNLRNPHLLSPYTITIGDEIQALFGAAGDLFRDAVTILVAIYPQRMRFALGIGELVTPVNPLQAIGMDGPTFYFAREGVLELKKSSTLFILKGEGIPNQVMICQALALVSHSLARWNHTRLQSLALLMEGLPAGEIAERLQISDQAVYKTINAGALRTVQGIFSEIESALDSALKE